MYLGERFPFVYLVPMMPVRLKTHIFIRETLYIMWGSQEEKADCPMKFVFKSLCEDFGLWKDPLMSNLKFYFSCCVV